MDIIRLRDMGAILFPAEFNQSLIAMVAYICVLVLL
jgi:hypothetical protein